MFRSIIQKSRNFAIIKQKSAIVDGKITWFERTCHCMVLDFTHSDIQHFGAIQNGKIVFITPCEKTFIPQLPGIIVIDGVEYDMKGIKTYKNLQGVVIGYRIAIAGA